MASPQTGAESALSGYRIHARVLRMQVGALLMRPNASLGIGRTGGVKPAGRLCGSWSVRGSRATITSRSLQGSTWHSPGGSSAPREPRLKGRLGCKPAAKYTLARRTRGSEAPRCALNAVSALDLGLLFEVLATALDTVFSLASPTRGRLSLIGHGSALPERFAEVSFGCHEPGAHVGDHSLEAPKALVLGLERQDHVLASLQRLRRWE
jgi:hypothetical protein